MCTRAAALGSLLIVVALPVAAQVPQQTADSASRPYPDWLVTASFGVPGFRGEPVMQLFTIGVQWTQLRPGRLGADVSLGTMPRALAEGVLVLGFRGGVALPVPVTQTVVLLPSTGVSLIGAAAGGGGGGAAGLNAGIAAAFFGTGPIGLRTGITWHRFEDAREAVWLIEMGFFGIPTGRRLR